MRLISHTFKVLERITDQRLRAVMNRTPDQRGFVGNVSTTGAVHVVLLSAEKYKEKHRTTHAVFLDLAKAFDEYHMKLSVELLEYTEFKKINWI